MQCGRVRERACFGKGHGCSDLLGHLMLELFEVCIGSEIVIAHCPLEQDQGMTAYDVPRLHLWCGNDREKDRPWNAP